MLIYYTSLCTFSPVSPFYSLLYHHYYNVLFGIHMIDKLAKLDKLGPKKRKVSIRINTMDNEEK